MQKIFCLVFSIVLLVQHTAWAAGELNPEQSFYLQRFVEHFNALSDSEKRAELLHTLKDQTSEEQQYFKKFVESPKAVFPKLSLKGPKIVFTWPQKELSLTPKISSFFEFKGKTIDLGKGKLINAVKEIDAIMSSQSAGILDFIICPAYGAFDDGSWGLTPVFVIIGLAVSGIIVALGGLPALGIAAGGLALGYIGKSAFFLKDKYEVNKKCQEAKDKLHAMKLTTPQHQLAEAAEMLIKARGDLKTHPVCTESSYGSSKYDLCQAGLACIDILEEEIQSAKKINEDDRNTKKDIPETDVQRAKKSKSSKQ